MANEVVGVWTPGTAEEMSGVIDAAIEMAKAEGHHADTVYPNKQRVTLVRETLSDGSKVMNLCFFDGGR